MTSRSQRYEISRPQLIQYDPPPPAPPPQLPAPSAPKAPEPADYSAVEPLPWSSGLPRPLSDIRELSEPSMMDNFLRQPQRHRRNTSRASSTKRKDSVKHEGPGPAERVKTVHGSNGTQIPKDASSDYSSTPEQMSFFSIPQSSVPRRSSSFQRQARSHTRKPSIRTQPSSSLAPPTGPGFSIPNRGTSQSPVKEARLKLDPISSDAARRIPSCTHVRSPHPSEILEYPSYKHPRIRLELQVSAPLFVGGGSVEGYVKITVDDNERARQRRSLSIGAISVDLLGFEQIDNSRKATFLALGTELIDANHPPPAGMVQSSDPFFSDERFWSLAPSCSALPFMISLPLDTGPPPFQSKHASIRFMLSVTALVRDSGKHYRVRTSQDVQVLRTYDPEKALTSLSSPLTASDELRVPRASGQESLKVTAGLHRQVWVSGSSIFVDVHVLNKCRKPVKRLELTLERDILCYKHAAAATLEKSAGQARIFESNERSILVKTCFKSGTAGWQGVEPQTADIRTCELELPRGHGTVRCGKYFEVRYFLNVTAVTSNSRIVSVQLPIILIHMNSLDVMPNSVAQVAAAIEEKRANRQLNHSRSRKQEYSHSRQRSFSSPAQTFDLKRQPSYTQGRAFAAPRQQSLDRQREHRADIEDLRNILDSSPRKHAAVLPKGICIRKTASHTSLATLNLAGRSTETLGVLGAMSYDTPTSHGVVRQVDDKAGGLRGRMMRMGSTDSMRSKRPGLAVRARKGDQTDFSQVTRPTVPPAQIGPYTLGLSSTTRKVSMDAPSERSGTAMSIREKLDKSRFEFQAVRKKASGGLKERSMNWLEARRNRDRGKDREGWI